jgi:hypothetical protein
MLQDYKLISCMSDNAGGYSGVACYLMKEYLAYITNYENDPEGHYLWLKLDKALGFEKDLFATLCYFPPTASTAYKRSDHLQRCHTGILPVTPTLCIFCKIEISVRSHKSLMNISPCLGVAEIERDNVQKQERCGLYSRACPLNYRIPNVQSYKTEPKHSQSCTKKISTAHHIKDNCIILYLKLCSIERCKRTKTSICCNNLRGYNI